MEHPDKVSVFEYMDYREFLRDWYHQAKKTRPGFSFRNFARRAGFKSTNFFKLVMDGDRNLTQKSLSKFLLGLNLNKQEQDFFSNLVFFNQCKSHKEKNIYYERLIQSRKFSQLKPISKDQYDYCSNWYHAVIRELVAHPDFDGSADWLAQNISPEITSAQAEKSLQLLANLGFIKRAPDDKWEQSTPLVSTGAEVASIALFNFHKNLLDLSKEALENIDAAKRDISAVTLGINSERIPLLKEKIQQFRQDILKFVSADERPNTVVWLNIQMFPATQITKEGEKK